jgi:hypothetical protein
MIAMLLRTLTFLEIKTCVPTEELGGYRIVHKLRFNFLSLLLSVHITV